MATRQEVRIRNNLHLKKKNKKTTLLLRRRIETYIFNKEKKKTFF